MRLPKRDQFFQGEGLIWKTKAQGQAEIGANERLGTFLIAERSWFASVSADFHRHTIPAPVNDPNDHLETSRPALEWAHRHPGWWERINVHRVPTIPQTFTLLWNWKSSSKKANDSSSTQLVKLSTNVGWARLMAQNSNHFALQRFFSQLILIYVFDQRDRIAFLSSGNFAWKPNFTPLQLAKTRISRRLCRSVRRSARNHSLLFQKPKRLSIWSTAPSSS